MYDEYSYLKDLYDTHNITHYTDTMLPSFIFIENHPLIGTKRPSFEFETFQSKLS